MFDTSAWMELGIAKTPRIFDVQLQMWIHIIRQAGQ